MRLKKTTIIHVDGIDYEWWVHHEPKWCTGDGWKGLSLVVRPVKSAAKQLILEFPMNFRTRRSTPQQQRPTVPQHRLADCVRRALAAGWEPATRGKAFFYEVEGAEQRRVY